MSATGTTTVNFGSGSTDTTATVSAPGISGTSMVEAWIFPSATATNTVDNHWFDDLTVIAGNIQSGTGFTIYAKCNTGKAHGTFTIGWVHT
jgi:hypothetical protein